MHLNKEEYADLLRQGKEMLRDYSHTTQVKALSISGSKATVKTAVHETATLGEHSTFRAVTAELNHLKKRNGKLVLTRIEARPTVGQ